MKTTSALLIVMVLAISTVSCAKHIAVDPVEQLTRSVEAISQSDMKPEDKPQALVTVKEGVKELAQLEKEKSGGFWGRFFDWTLNLVPLGLSAWAAYEAKK